jgi:hypothetical protein
MPARKHRARVAFVILASLALLTAACGSGHEKQISPRYLAPAAPKKAPRAPGASVRFLWPRTGSVVGPTFTVRVAVHGFRLGASRRGGSTPSGHLHFILDGGRFDEPQFAGANGRKALRMGVNGYYSPADRPTITYRHIGQGKHVLEAVLAVENHTATAVSAKVHFRVR